MRDILSEQSGRFHKIARLYGKSQSIVIKFGGLAARTDCVSTIELPDNVDAIEGDDELLDLMEGFLDHEVGHIAVERRVIKEQDAGSDARGWVDVAKGFKGNRERALTNILEDWRQEREHAAGRPGIRENLDRVINHCTEKLLKLKAEKGELPAFDQFSIGVMMKLNGLDRDWLDPEVNKYIDDLSATIEQIKDAENPGDSNRIANELIGALDEQIEEERRQKEIAIGCVRAKEGGGDGDVEEFDEDLPFFEEDELEERDGADADEEDVDSDDDVDLDNPLSDDNVEEVEEDDGGDVSDDEDADDPKEEEEELEDGDADAELPDIDSESGDVETGEGTDSEEDGSIASELQDDGGVEFGGTSDAIKEELEKRCAEAAADEGHYLVHPTIKAADVVAPFDHIYPTLRRDYALMRQEYEVTVASEMGGAVGAIRRKIQSILITKTYDRIHRGLPDGDLDESALADLKTGSRDVFQQQVVGDKIDTAVELMLDCSGSMYGRIRFAKIATAAVCEAMDAIGIPFELTTYTTRSDVGRTYAKSLYDESGPYTRMEPVEVVVYKSFAEKWKRVKGRVSNISAQFNNADGDSILYAAKRLLARPERRKILVWFSDGLPAIGYYGACDCRTGHRRTTAYHHSCPKTARERKRLADVVASIKAAGVEIGAIGIETDHVGEYTDDWVLVNDTSNLASQTFKLLRSIMRLKRS